MKVAISSDFFTALSKLPKSQLNKTIKLVEKFKNNPRSPGLNYEKLHFADNMHSIRVDGGYRCIVMSPEKNDVYILLWVDNHDAAYDWAKKHKCLVNVQTGSLEIIQTTHTTEEITVETKPHQETFFSKFKDKDLLKLGINEEILPYVKTIHTEEDLDNFRQYISEEVFEALFYLLSGDSLEEVYNYLYADNDTVIESDDFTKALENDSSKRSFYVVEEDDTELMNMLNAPLEKWRVFLHPTQRKLVEKSYNGPVRVLGGAGTGKTVVAMHRAKQLATQMNLFDNQKILFTTYTKNLAIDIYENLKKICDEETLSRIEVKNLDQWVYEFLNKHGYKNEIVYENKTSALWERAVAGKDNTLDLDDGFFKEEWERVIQKHAINTLNDYIKVSRAGRGTRLSRAQRKLIWEVFEQYRLLLSTKDYKEPSDAMRDVRVLLKNDNRQGTRYAHIVVDEAQDLNDEAFRLLRDIVPEGKNDMFIVGDAHQRIYGHKVVLGQCGIKIIGRSKKLKLNYRTTDEIRKWAVALLNGEVVDDMDDGIDSNKDYKSLYHGPKPLIKHFESYEDEVKFIESYIKDLKKEDEVCRICIVARTQKIIDSYNNDLNNKNIPTMKISRNTKDNISNTGIRLATMHRVKGLDFDHVIIASMNKGIVPLEFAERSEEEQIEVEKLTKEKSLVFVAATRAKKSLLVSCYGERSEFL